MNMEKVEGRNWIQRQLIQQELARRKQPQLPQQGEGEPVDPLLPVKRYY